MIQKLYALEVKLLHPAAHFGAGVAIAKLAHLCHAPQLACMVIPGTIGLAKELVDWKYEGKFTWSQFIATALGGLI